MSEVRINRINLRAQREAQGLTQGQLAVKAGVNQSYISKLEKGERKTASLAAVGKLAAALRVPVAELLVQTRPGKPNELPEFHAYISRKFPDDPRLRQALASVYDAIKSVEEEEESLDREREERRQREAEEREQRRQAQQQAPDSGTEQSEPHG